jgi:hypothetical protein
MLNSKGKQLFIEKIEERFEVSVDDSAGKIKIRGMLLRQARRIIQYLLDKTETYQPFILDW